MPGLTLLQWGAGASQQQSSKAGFPWWAGLIIALVALGIIGALLGLACFARAYRRKAKRGAALEEVDNKVIADRVSSQCPQDGHHSHGSDVVGLHHFLYSSTWTSSQDVGKAPEECLSVITTSGNPLLSQMGYGQSSYNLVQHPT